MSVKSLQNLPDNWREVESQTSATYWDAVYERDDGTTVTADHYGEPIDGRGGDIYQRVQQTVTLTRADGSTVTVAEDASKDRTIETLRHLIYGNVT